MQRQSIKTNYIGHTDAYFPDATSGVEAVSNAVVIAVAVRPLSLLLVVYNSSLERLSGS